MHLGPILSPIQPIKDNGDNGIKTVIYLLSHNVTIVFMSYLLDKMWSVNYLVRIEVHTVPPHIITHTLHSADCSNLDC